MVRLFVALGLPETLRLRLAALRGGVPGARWVKPENLHLSLRFIGEVENGAADDLDAALGNVAAPAFEIAISGIGHYGKAEAARILWAGVEPNGALDRLQAKIEACAVRAGLPPEQRRFSPHVTLARVRQAPGNRVEQFVADNDGFRAGPIAIDRFTLFSSFLSSSGAIYRPEAEYPLAGRPDEVAHGRQL
jgi:2'-5' RNA ligase